MKSTLGEGEIVQQVGESLRLQQTQSLYYIHI